MDAAGRQKWKRRGLMLAVVALTLGTIEVLARWTSPEPLKAELAGILHDRSDGYDGFLTDRATLLATDPSPRKYADYYLYRMGAFESESIEFAADGSRSCPSSQPGDGATRIWFFGGSTMENLEAPDHLTVADQTVQSLNTSGCRTTARNYGTRAFQSSLELARFQDLVRHASPESLPNIAVFYDGYNDAVHAFTGGAGQLQANVSGSLKLMVEQRYGGVLLFGLSRGLSQWSVFWRRTFANWLLPDDIAKRVKPDLSERNLQRSIDAYLRNVRMIRAVAREFGIQPRFVLQPLVVTKAGRGDVDERAWEALQSERRAFIEGFYAGVRVGLANAPDFVDLSGCLDNNGRSDFIDLGHTGPETGRDIGAALAESLAAVCESSKASP